MSRVYNFSAGPAVLPETVLKEVADDGLPGKWYVCNGNEPQKPGIPENH